MLFRPFKKNCLPDELAKLLLRLIMRSRLNSNRSYHVVRKTKKDNDIITQKN